MTKKSEYDLRAEKFLTDTETTLEIKKSAIQSPPEWDHSPHAHKHIKYDVKLKNARGEFFFNFWGSIAEWEAVNYDNKKPKVRPYDVLAALQSSEPLTDYYEFCREFGYEPSHEAERIFKAVWNEWENLKRLFSEEELQKLAEIQ